MCSTYKTYLFGLILAISSCHPEKSLKTGDFLYFMGDLQKQINICEAGDTLFLPQGQYSFDQSLIIQQKHDITIIGQGMGKTILSFHQLSNGNGIEILNAENIHFKGFTILNAPLANLKIQGCQYLHLEQIESAWTFENSQNNGLFGINLVDNKFIQIKNTKVKHAQKACILAQSSQFLEVSKNQIEYSEIGLSVLNNQIVDIYENQVKNNGIGIRISNNLADQPADNVRIFNNIISHNNRKDHWWTFHHYGMGIKLEGANQIEIFDNRFSAQNVSAVLATNSTVKEEKNKAINILGGINLHDNVYDSSWFVTPNLMNPYSRKAFFVAPFNQRAVIWVGSRSTNEPVTAKCSPPLFIDNEKNLIALSPNYYPKNHCTPRPLYGVRTQIFNQQK
ncbi:right-handed parallel beta-helix repeat-containing protein [Persicobacter diffluens]|uniref:Right handed beta helix domain-containing protein n=1 Tax=Persicobacter diffluens TaxID=981 RepID=A0AAN4W3E8_9BACT|nr:hypothetical protein PEDI_40940 [Persicobacter diffluens]